MDIAIDERLGVVHGSVAVSDSGIGVGLEFVGTEKLGVLTDVPIAGAGRVYRP